MNEEKGIEDIERMFTLAFRQPCKVFINVRQGAIDFHNVRIVVGDYVIEGTTLKLTTLLVVITTLKFVKS